MTLTVAVQMDPLDAINIAGDSTFALMLSAQARGHRLFHYTADALTYEAGRVHAGAYPVTVRREPGDHFTFGDFTILDLGRDTDVVLMRQDPPFDLGYITATHLLERVQGQTLVVNDPASVRNAPEKVWVLDFARFMPPTMVTRSLGAARKFLEEHGEIVVKPLHGNGGKAIFKADQLIGAVTVRDSDDIFILAQSGKMIRFQANEVPPKEGVVQGVNCMGLRNDEVTAVAVATVEN